MVLRRIWQTLKRREPHSDLVLLAMNPYFIPKKFLRDAVRQEAARLDGNLVVDVGCGWQPYRCYFNHFRRYIGLDLAAYRHPDVISAAERLPLRSAVADTVLCTEMLEHTREPKQVCAELARVLRGGGTLLLSAPMSWNLHYEPYDYYRFTRYGLVYLLEEAGLEIVKVVRVGGLISLIGARFVDVIQRNLQGMPLVNRWRRRGVFATLLVMPVNLCFMVLASLFDRLDDSDAIGWLVVGRKPED